jgi:hypothetical protein
MMRACCGFFLLFFPFTTYNNKGAQIVRVKIVSFGGIFTIFVK